MFDTDAYRFCVVGLGRLGSTLLIGLQTAGFVVAAVAGRSDPATGTATRRSRLPLADAVRSADVLWLTVPDDAIAEVAAEIADLLGDRSGLGLVAIHSSGLGRLSLLDPLRAAGAATLCLHPLQTFSADGPHPGILDGVPFAVTASDDSTAAFGSWLAERLGGRPFPLHDDHKPLYHLAAVVASNLFVALESEAADLMGAATARNADGGTQLLAPIVAATAANLGACGPAAALTGPVARGDVGTVRSHLHLLGERAPRFVPTYKALSLQALRLAAPRLDNEAVRTLRALLAPEAAAR